MSKKVRHIDMKLRSISIPVVVNPGPSELRELWLNAKRNPNIGDPNQCNFMINKHDDLYVWAGTRGLHRFVIPRIGEKQSDFKAYGVFRTQRNDPRKLDKLEYVSKNAFMQVSSEILVRKFMKLVHSLKLKKAPGFQASA